MGHHYGQLSSIVMDNMDKDGLEALDRYMTVEESMISV
jgi:hypothetical protein